MRRLLFGAVAMATLVPASAAHALPSVGIVQINAPSGFTAPSYTGLAGDEQLVVSGDRSRVTFRAGAGGIVTSLDADCTNQGLSVLVCDSEDDYSFVVVDAGLGNDFVDTRGWTFAEGFYAAIVKGGDGDDLLLGGAAADRLHGDAGDDTVRGGGGEDNLIGDAGRDRLYGEAGDDQLYSEDGGVQELDTLNCGAGDDSAHWVVPDVTVSCEHPY